MKDIIENRVSKEVQVPEDTFLEGLLDITEFLFSELENFLEEENRYHGITKSYMNTVNIAFCKFNKEITEDDVIIYGKVLYLFKPILKREFKRLKDKKLSLGDVTIVIINKILSIITEEKTIGFRFSKELKTLRKIITKLFDNIKMKRKEDPLYQLSNSIKTYKDSGYVGKYCLDHFSFLEKSDIEKSKLSDPGPRISMCDNDKLLKEVIF